MGYYYTRDHERSVREMCDGSGTIVARYSYDPYGRATKVSGSIDATRQYGSYYLHQPSGLFLTKYRAYDSGTGRWLSRDPIGEVADADLYRYVRNHPINSNDYLGLIEIPDPWSDILHQIYNWEFPHATPNCCKKFKFVGFDVQKGTGFLHLNWWELVAAKCKCVEGNGSDSEAEIRYWQWGLFPINTPGAKMGDAEAAAMPSGTSMEKPGKEDAAGDGANAFADLAEAASESGDKEPDDDNGTYSGVQNYISHLTPADGQAACDGLVGH